MNSSKQCGGLVTRNKYGTEYYSAIGSLGGRPKFTTPTRTNIKEVNLPGDLPSMKKWWESYQKSSLAINQSGDR